MKFYRIILAITAVLSSVGVNARVMYVGNLVHEGEFTNTGVTMRDTTYSAVEIAPDDVKNMLGAKLKSVSAYYNDYSKPKFFKIFVTSRLNKAPIFEKVVDPTTVSRGWNKIDLNVPHVITSDTLYIGCCIAASSIGYAVQNESDVKSYFRKGRKGEWTPAAGVAVYGVVEGDNLPANDVALSLKEESAFALVNEPISADLVIRNMAADVLKSIDVEYNDGEGNTVAKSFSGLNVPYLKTDTVAVEGLKFASVDKFDVTFRVAKVNGQADFDPSNNSQTFKVNSFSEFIDRKVLLEVLSTEKCTGCPKGHEKLERAINGNENIIEVSHHIGFYTDQWTMPEADQYLQFYQVATTFAPAAMIDRTNMSRFGAVNSYKGGNNSVVFGVPETDDVENLFKVALAKPAEVKLSLTSDLLNDTVLAVDVKGEALSTLENDARLTVYVTEDNLYTDQQAGWSEEMYGPYYQHNVVRAYVSDQWGDFIDVNAGFAKKYEVKVNSKWNVDNLNVVAFVHNSSADDNTVTRYQGFNVYNSEMVQVKPHSVDVEEIENAPVYVICRNDGVVEILGEYKSGRVYSINGVEVCTMRGSPLVFVSGWTKGVYVFELLLQNGDVYRTKVII